MGVEEAHAAPSPLQAQQAEERAAATARWATPSSSSPATLGSSVSAAHLGRAAAGEKGPSRAQASSSSSNPRLNKRATGGVGSASVGTLPLAQAPQQQQQRAPPPQLSLHAANIGRYYRYTPYGALTESLLGERDALCAGLRQLRGTLEAWERGRIEELTRYEVQVRVG